MRIVKGTTGQIGLGGGGALTEVRPNRQLADMLVRLNCSNKGLGARVRAVAARHGKILKCDHVTVKKWLDGVRPRPQTAAFIAEALSEKAGRPISLEEIGMAYPGIETPEDPLEYPEAVAGSHSRLLRLSARDLAEEATAAMGISRQAWTSSMMKWLLSRPTTKTTSNIEGTSVQVGAADVHALCATKKLFMQLDFQFGGGHARTALAQYFAHDVLPLLRGRFTEATGRGLFSAVSDVAELLGWTAYDLGRHGLAQRYLVQALRLAQAGNDRVKGGSILASMSHQATYLGHFAEAAQLARAAQEGTKGVATPTVTAMFLAMEARAHAGDGSERECSIALREAEIVYAKRRSSDDPPWISYFDDAELAGEQAHCFRDLRQPTLAREFVTEAVKHTDPSFARTLAFVRLVHASSYIHDKDKSVDKAATVGVEALRLAGNLKSKRYLRYVRDLCTDFAPYSDNPAAREFLDLAAALRDD